MLKIVANIPKQKGNNMRARGRRLLDGMLSVAVRECERNPISLNELKVALSLHSLSLSLFTRFVAVGEWWEPIPVEAGDCTDADLL